jgi:hypothetical protein
MLLTLWKIIIVKTALQGLGYSNLGGNIISKGWSQIIEDNVHCTKAQRTPSYPRLNQLRWQNNLWQLQGSWFPFQENTWKDLGCLKVIKGSYLFLHLLTYVTKIMRTPN